MQRHRVVNPLFRQFQQRILCSTGFRALSTTASTTATTSSSEGPPSDVNATSDDAVTAEAVKAAAEKAARKAEAKRLKWEKKWTETDFLKRRKVYDDKIKSLRKDFQQLKSDQENEAKRKEEKRSEQLLQIRVARSKRRREKSLIKVAQHRQRIEVAMKKAGERADHGYVMWKAEKERVHQAKLEKLNTLEKASATWISDETLDSAIEQVVDDFMVSTGVRTEIARSPVEEQQPSNGNSISDNRRNSM